MRRGFRWLYLFLALLFSGVALGVQPAFADECDGPPGAGLECCNENHSCDWDQCHISVGDSCHFAGEYPLCSTGGGCDT